MKKIFTQYFFSFILGILILIGAGAYFGLPSDDPNDESQFDFENDLNYEKQRGAHIFGRVDSTNLLPLIRNNVEWVTYVPYGDQKDFNSPTMNYYKNDSLGKIRRDSIWLTQINIAHSAGLKVFLKPHVWIYAPTDGKWRSDIFPTSDENWELWKKNYREFILIYADIAQRGNVELFCIGVEFTRLAIEKPEFWKELIQEVRSVYSGKITYAANWYKEFNKITFWDQLDFIGIQAYFPLVKNQTPTIKQISKGWKKHIPSIERIYKKFDKKILFTEMGYKSTTDSAIKPWEWIDYDSNSSKLISMETQANCYEAFFNSIWKKKWFAGVHIWQWRCDSKGKNRHEDKDFTPRWKPAEDIIAKGFKK